MKPDFEKLRAERNAKVREMFADLAILSTTFDPDACYCACPDGPCEHDFQGWREFEDGRGGEMFCSRCGLGAMSHSLRCGP